MKKKEDLRIVKTKNSLYTGLLKLMKNKTFEEIKVSEICKISMINRSTFYDHFNDKYELLQSFIETLKDELIDYLKINEKTNSVKEYYLKLINLLLEHIEKNIDIYSSIIKNNTNSIANDMMINAAIHSVNSHLKENFINTSDTPTEIITIFYVSAVINVCIEAIKNQNNFNKKNIANYFENLIPEADFLIPKK